MNGDHLHLLAEKDDISSAGAQRTYRGKHDPVLLEALVVRNRLLTSVDLRYCDMKLLGEQNHVSQGARVAHLR